MNRNNLIIFSAILVFFALISLYFDSQIIEGINSLRNSFIDDFFIGITFLSSKIVIFLFITSIFLNHDHKRRWILPLWVTMFFAAVVSFLLKIIIQRPRPYIEGIVSTLPSLQEASHIIWNFSFPSFSSMLIFSLIPFVSLKFYRFRYLWVLFASLVAFSRIYFGLHFLSDVLIGSLIGYLIGILIVRLEKKHKLGKRIYDKLTKKG